MSPARPLSDTERRDWVRLARTQNVGPVTFAQLVKRFGAPGAARCAAILVELELSGRAMTLPGGLAARMV